MRAQLSHAPIRKRITAKRPASAAGFDAVDANQEKHFQWAARHKDILLQLPEECLPQATRHGEWCWRIVGPGNRYAIEVSVQKRFFLIKRFADGVERGKRQFTWSKYDSVEAAWAAATHAAGFGYA